MLVETRKFEVELDDSIKQTTNLPYTRTIEFINNTTKEVWVFDRNNIPILIEPSGNYLNQSQRRFIIRTHHRFHSDRVLEKVTKFMADVKRRLDSTTTSFELMKGVLERKYENSQNDFCLFAINSSISEKDLESSTAVFDRETGFTVCVDNSAMYVLNPESIESRRNIDIGDYVTSRPNGTLFEIVDHTGSIADRWIYSSGDATKINVIRDVTRPCGLYVYVVKDLGDAKSHTTKKFYSLEPGETDPELTFDHAVEKYHLFLTREEAITKGNPELISKGKLQELEQAHKLEIQNLEKEKNNLAVEHKKILNELELSSKRREEELANLKDELERRKAARNDYYESRSSDRKDTSELIKFIPAVFLGFIGAAVLFRK